jgi:uncharacterized protein YecT (DUF1311 family)
MVASFNEAHPMIRLFCSLVFLGSIAGPALAQTNQPQTLREATRQFRNADDELNAVYQRCVDPESNTVQAIAALRDAQRQWIEVRDSTARAYQLGQTGKRPLDDEFYVHGRTVMTLSRTGDLRNLFGCD